MRNPFRRRSPRACLVIAVDEDGDVAARVRPGDGDPAEAVTLARAAFALTGGGPPGLPAFAAAGAQCGDPLFAEAFGSELARLARRADAPAVRATKALPRSRR
jgi:hypothetical protein